MESKASIPFLYRSLFLYLEPLSAFLGTIINIFDPSRYLQSLSPTATTATYSPLIQPVYGQLAALFLLFGWSQAVVLHSTDDLKVCKALLFGMFLCDSLYLFASFRILGPEVFFSPSLWRWKEWVNFVMLYWAGGSKLAFCAGVGVGREERGRVKSL